ncbi:membrane bound O-acyl transferase family-domain-containing protein [Xylariaceae sp. FL1272]|nr:membrane bound O-acyl transferase family-domain-containing protein [Xylariaceae sp. FL1272]
MEDLVKYWFPPIKALFMILLTRKTQFTIAQLLIIYTPKNSFLRTASIPVQIALGVAAFPYVQQVIVPPISIHYRVLAGGTVALQTILSITVSAMMRLDDKDAAAISKEPGVGAKISALSELMSNQRCLGTPYQISWVPPFDESRPGYVPSRSEAVFKSSRQIVLGYVWRQILITTIWGRGPAGLIWTIYMDSWLRLMYSTGDLIGLLSGDPVEMHPPAFGSLRHTTTLRGFWGKYWHQSNRFPFQGVANYICRDVLGLKSLPQRYMNLAVVFSLSGVFHIITDLAEGIPVGDSGALWLFCPQILCIMLEDAVQSLGRQWYQRRKESGSRFDQAQLASIKVVGFIWTWTVVSVTSGWFYAPHESIFLEKHGAPFGVVKSAASVLGYNTTLLGVPDHL